MAKGRNGKTTSRQASTQVSRVVPELPYDIKATFLPVEDRTVKHGKTEKGVLDRIALRTSREGVTGDATLRFLSSFTIGTHSALIRTAGLPEQPIFELPWAGASFTLASRYTVQPGRRGPVEVGLMVDSIIPGDVTGQRGYEEFIDVVAISVGSALVKHAHEVDANTAGFELRISNNFASGGVPDVVELTAGNITEMHRKLSAK